MDKAWIPAIRRLMAGKGWNQAQLSEVSGIRPNTISDVLAGSDPRMDTLAKLAAGLDVPLWALFCSEREFGVFSEQVKQQDANAVAARQQEQLREAVQAELAPMVDAIVAKLTGQSVTQPAKPLPAILPASRRAGKSR